MIMCPFFGIEEYLYLSLVSIILELYLYTNTMTTFNDIVISQDILFIINGCIKKSFLIGDKQQLHMAYIII